MKQTTIIPQSKFQNEALPFKVQSIKNFTEEQDDINEGPHSHNYYEMVWLIKGSGKLFLDIQEYTVEGDTIFCIRPNRAHQFQTRTDMEGFVFSFTDRLFKMDEYDFSWASLAGLSQLFAGGRNISVATEMEEDMKEIVLKIMKESENQSSYKIELLKRYFKIFLIYLTRGLDKEIQSAEKSREAELVKSFMELLDKQFKEEKMVNEYAAKLLVTANYLNRIVKKITGFSAGHHIRQRVILEAKRMGRYSGAGMKEIAYDLGFLDIAHFSRFFKSFGGANFTDFKRGSFIVPLNAGFHRA